MLLVAYCAKNGQRVQYHIDIQWDLTLLYPKQVILNSLYTGCHIRYQTRHFFNNSNTNEDIATKFEQEYFRCVRNKEECVSSVCVCSAPNFCDTEQQSAS
jgi:hypothetical protein